MNSRTPNFLAKLDVIQAELKQYEEKQDKMVRDAKADIGIWSSYSVGEARQRFWDAFESGKMFAQRQTFWQMIYTVMSSREDNLVSLVLEWLITSLMNFTLALLGSLFFYIFSLGAMVWSYKPDPVSAFSFFVLGFIGAASVVAGYLLALYGMAASGVYVVGKVLVRNRLEQGYDQRRRYRLD